MAASRYRTFLRLCEEWPLDPSKTGRDLGYVIRERVAEAFKHGETTNINVEECDKMYESLHRINTNYYKTKYARSGDNSVGAVGLSLDLCRMAVSNEGLQAIQNEDQGFFYRLTKSMSFKRDDNEKPK